MVNGLRVENGDANDAAGDVDDKDGNGLGVSLLPGREGGVWPLDDLLDLGVMSATDRQGL